MWWIIRGRSLASLRGSVLSLAGKRKLLFMLWNCPSWCLKQIDGLYCHRCSFFCFHHLFSLVFPLCSHCIPSVFWVLHYFSSIICLDILHLITTFSHLKYLSCDFFIHTCCIWESNFFMFKCQWSFSMLFRMISKINWPKLLCDFLCKL